MAASGMIERPGKIFGMHVLSIGSQCQVQMVIGMQGNSDVPARVDNVAEQRPGSDWQRQATDLFPLPAGERKCLGLAHV